MLSRRLTNQNSVFCSRHNNGIEHSENKIVTNSGMLENEIRPGVLQSSVRHTRVLQEYQKRKSRAADYVSILFVLPDFLRILCLLNIGSEQSRSNLVFEMHNNFICGMLYESDVQCYHVTIRVHVRSGNEGVRQLTFLAISTPCVQWPLFKFLHFCLKTTFWGIMAAF